MDLLQEVFIYLLAALVMVPLSKRLGAGIVIGPSTLGLIKDPDHILHFAELGVVFLLFVIGLELRPSRLWVMRKMVFGLGTAQMLATAIALTFVGLLFGLEQKAALIIGLILALSSTAFVLQMLAEKKQLTTTHGRAAFSILLLQDLAVIPLIAVLPMLGATAIDSGSLANFALAIAMIGALIVGGRYLLRPVLRLSAASGIPEIFTATALLVVIGAALLMQLAGLSMVLGAFIAGMLLADSEFRHQLEADIAPFKGLLLGLFFIAVGMSVNLGLLFQQPATIALIVLALIATKALVLFPLARLFGIGDKSSSFSLAVVLAQSGEFAFVLFAIAGRAELLDATLIDQLILAVAVSMLMTPIAYLCTERLGMAFNKPVEPVYDKMQNAHHEVIIAGFGRFGQIVGRVLAVTGKQFTALDIDPSQVDVVRRYGNVVHFGDSSKLELLRAAGAGQAKLFVLAVGNVESSIRTAETVTRHFPNLTIVARARNRHHQHHLMDLGIKYIYRETLMSSLAMSEQVLLDLGFDGDDSKQIVRTFEESDARLIQEQHAIQNDDEQLIQSAREAAHELEIVLKDDSR